jgi:CubicO group peptidase (beta-lactamase class C family)
VLKSTIKLMFFAGALLSVACGQTPGTRPVLGAAGENYPVPRFADPARVTKLQSAMPEIDRLFRDYATEKKIPGMVWGVVIDGRLAHTGTFGVRDRMSQEKVTETTAFRIASMTKSFTALAILKLRDEGKLGLDDPVSKWIPEFARMELPTRDSAPILIRNLLSHSAGFPEDNPWGDQQLSATDEQLDEWLKKGIPFSTAPGTRYEYSNYAFGLLGRVVAKASGLPYERYMRQEILSKLKMDSTTFEFSDVPAASRAIGYRLKPDSTYSEEPPLPHGVFGSMGGLITTANDLARYVAFHLSAWPARDDPETGPVRRSSVREMQHLWTPSNLTASIAGGTLQASETGYGFGLRVTSDCRFEQIVAHGGGLPGFGSYMAWLPDYGVGMFAMATLTYSGPAEPISQAWNVMLKTGALLKRDLPPTALQHEMRGHVWNLWNKWDEEEVKQIASMNLLVDAPSQQRQEEIAKLKGEVGQCSAASAVRAENWLRGQFNLTCARGTVGVFFTLAPTQPPRVQHLAFQKLSNDKVIMGAPTGAPAGVACTQ